MHRNHTAPGLATIAGLLLGAALAFADDVSPSQTPPPMPGREFCKENPGKCEAARARHQAFCQENPQQCEQMKQKRAERREFCKQNPAKCQEQRAQMRERFQEHHGGADSAPTPQE